MCFSMQKGPEKRGKNCMWPVYHVQSVNQATWCKHLPELGVDLTHAFPKPDASTWRIQIAILFQSSCDLRIGFHCLHQRRFWRASEVPSHSPWMPPPSHGNKTPMTSTKDTIAATSRALQFLKIFPVIDSGPAGTVQKDSLRTIRT